MRFSIIIPVAKLNSYLEESIPKILELDFPKEEYEILILPNSIPKNLPEYAKHRQITLIKTGKVSPAIKRDIGASKSQGHFLCFLDDDAYPQSDWLNVAKETFLSLSEDYAAINGPAVTPKDSTKFEKISGAFFESSFGGGAAHRCKDIKRSFDVDDAPSVNFIVNKDIFLKLGGFGSEYWPGEDSLFCHKLKDNNYKIYYKNNLIVSHHRRKTISAHLEQVAGYGKHRGNFFRKGIGCSRKLTYLAPSVFLITNILLLYFSWPLWFIIIGFYIWLLLFDLFANANTSIVNNVFVAGLTYLSHLTYGFYFIKGFFTKDVRSKLR